MEKKTIKNTIFKNMIWLVCTAAGIAIVSMLIIVYIFLSADIKESQISATEHTAQYLNTLPSSNDKINYLSAMYNSTKSERETLISPTGQVLFDSGADIAEMENHLSRPEVKEARTSGRGEASRSSSTVGRRVFYCAALLGDGSVLRSARPMMAINQTVITLIPASLLLMILIILGAGATSKKLTRKIVQPIQNIDINDMDLDEMYPELVPFFKRLTEENAEKEKTEAIRREFSANVSHELKTPLTSISGYAQIISNGMARPEDITMFGLKIEKESERLLLLIDDIIRLSRLDETNGIDEPETVDLDEVAQETISHLESHFKSKDIAVYYSGEKSIVSGRKTMLGELAYNLIDNAIKYNNYGGRVDVYVGNSPRGTELSVKDTGIGIADEDIERIFERFYRVDKSRSKTVGGTGLGLSIVKHIAMIHNADIDVKSKVGEGTTITVTFVN